VAEERDGSDNAEPVPFSLFLNAAGEVVLIKDADRIVLGPLEASCAEMRRFLGETLSR